MKNEYATPIHHGTLSGLATTTYEAGKAGAKGFIKSAISGGVIGAVLLGGVTATAAVLFGIPAILGAATIGAGFAAAGGVAATALGFGTLAGLAGGLLGTAAMFTPLGQAVIAIGTGLGLYKGTKRGFERVAEERGAASMLDAQVAVAKAQAVAQAPTVSTAPRHNAAYMNAAPSTIQAGNDNVQYDGRVVGEQLAAAR